MLKNLASLFSPSHFWNIFCISKPEIYDYFVTDNNHLFFHWNHRIRIFLDWNESVSSLEFFKNQFYVISFSVTSIDWRKYKEKEKLALPSVPYSFLKWKVTGYSFPQLNCIFKSIFKSFQGKKLRENPLTLVGYTTILQMKCWDVWLF